MTDMHNDDEFHIPGYQIVRKDRPDVKKWKERGGGLLLYVKDTFDIIECKSTFTIPTEYLNVTINKQYLPPINLTLLYRAPTAKKCFEKELENHLIQCQSMESYLIGDFNLKPQPTSRPIIQ